jgi:hypothetical protein
MSSQNGQPARLEALNTASAFTRGATRLLAITATS